MLTSIEIEDKIKLIKPELISRFGVSRIGYFGSFAKQTQTNDSDLDMIVEFSKPVGWGFFTLQQFLEQSLGLPIDLVTQNALKEQIKDAILNQVKYI